MKEFDERPEAVQLLKNIKAAKGELEKLRWEANEVYEDGIYRFYHTSFKIYGLLQNCTERMVILLRSLSPDKKPLDDFFEEIVEEGTKQRWDITHNKTWTIHTRPILEAFFHARYFIEMMIAHGSELEQPPCLLPSGWASILTLYNIR